jgi:hypothetical protein
VGKRLQSLLRRSFQVRSSSTSGLSVEEPWYAWSLSEFGTVSGRMIKNNSKSWPILRVKSGKRFLPCREGERHWQALEPYKINRSSFCSGCNLLIREPRWARPAAGILGHSITRGKRQQVVWWPRIKT